MIDLKSPTRHLSGIVPTHQCRQGLSRGYIAPRDDHDGILGAKLAKRKITPPSVTEDVTTTKATYFAVEQTVYW
jgi:hypothetical protein